MATAKINPSDRLQSEIDKRRAEIRSDQYPISIGELMAMYSSGELIISPDYQRYFRWSQEHKSKFIESILLGIPIPSIFVAQRENGQWEVVDGLQRLSTIFQFADLLKNVNDADGFPFGSLILKGTKYLPSLDGFSWSGVKQLSDAQKLFFKRSKLDVKIVLKESGDSAKYELFQRLNTGGQVLAEQEIRNAMLVAAAPEFYEWISDLARYKSFVETVNLSDKAYDERYDLELILRYLLLRDAKEEELSRLGDVNDYITDNLLGLASRFKSKTFERKETDLFMKTFDLANEVMGEDAFKSYDSARKRFYRAFAISTFEAVAIGIGFHVAKGHKIEKKNLRLKIEKLLGSNDFKNSSGSGVRASTRIPKVIQMGRKLIS